MEGYIIAAISVSDIIFTKICKLQNQLYQVHVPYKFLLSVDLFPYLFKLNYFYSLSVICILRCLMSNPFM